MTTVTCPASLLDPTGKDDVADKLRGWLATVPSGKSAQDMTHAVVPPGTYRNEGGIGGAVTLAGKANVSLDMSGVKFVQRTKRPFAVTADGSNGNENPAGRWNIVYTPTLATKATFEGWRNKASAQEQAIAKCKLLNRSRDFFKFNKCARLRLRGARMTGGAGIDPAFNDDFEAQNGIGFYGSVDCELADCEISQMFGNGIEANAYVDDDGTYVPTTGLWVHDSGLSDFGRQAASLSYGRGFTLERCDLAGSLNGRALIDMEPTTDRNPPGQEATVQGVYVVKCNIGKHRLGMIAAGLTRGDVRNIYVSGCTGNSIGISGTAVCRRVIFEDNTDSDPNSSPYACKFLRGPHGGEDYIYRRNKVKVSTAAVLFHDGQGAGGCENYLVTDNPIGARPQFIDNNVPKWSGKFVPFSLPIPHHALRDL